MSLINRIIAIWVIVLLAPATALSGNLNHPDRWLIQRWVEERNRAAARYLALWLTGAPLYRQAVPATALLSYEVNIVMLCLGKGQLLERHALLWSREVNEKTLPVVLLEAQYGVDLGITSFFTSGFPAPPLWPREIQLSTSIQRSVLPERGLVWAAIGRTVTLPADLFLAVSGLGLKLIEPQEESLR